MKRPSSLKPAVLMGLCRDNGKEGGWEAEAIEHWRWQLANGEGKERVLAWVKLHSIARGQPKCVDEAGLPLRVESCAADLGISIITAQHHCSALVAEGRVRLKKTQLWYRADVPEIIPLAAVPVADGTDEENCWVHDNFQGYLADSYWKQPTEKRAQIRATWDRFRGWSQQAFLEGLAGLRHEISRIETNTLDSLGLPKIVLPKKAAQNPRWFQLALLGEPDFVHDKGTEPVSMAVNTTKSGGVQAGPSLLPVRADQTAMRSPPPSPNQDLELEVMVMASRIEGFNLKTAEQLLKSCRAVEPSLRALEVIHLAEAKLRASPGAHSPVGLLLKTLPEEAAGPPLARAREAARREEERTLRDAQDLEAREVQYRHDAEQTLLDPNASESDVEWAREVLARAKGAGDAS